MNQTDKIMRQYFVQYPILKSVENYQCLVNFIFVFELLILYVPSFVFLAKSVIWTANFTAFFVQHNKFLKKNYCTVLVYTRDSTKASTRSPKHTMVNRTTHGK